ncbi:tumor necrosis factor receptor superfamily member 21-like [Mya arenaria]|uniref:tumor necrosis factor receptor superfamily member 21-like n=1 Tax=Mya arenaria TaxID=6604 RepID=UPI0022E60C35|nr:tumor necrosis factor receptor superfamily member 21-like [Mya arenaria]
MKMLGRFIVTINCLVMLSFQVSMVDLVEPIPYLIKIVKPLSTCGPGKYLNANINSSGRCKKCRPCAKGYVEVSPCSKYQNTRCQLCPPGTFNDRRNGVCNNCTACDKGFFVRRPCLPSKDTKCRKCPEGTFSVDGTRWGCKYCKICSEIQDEILPCTTENDRVCTDDNQIDSAQSEVIWTETEVEDNVEFNTHTRLVLVATCTAISFTFLIVLLAWTLQTYRHFANRYQTTLCKICVL